MSCGYDACSVIKIEQCVLLSHTCVTAVRLRHDKFTYKIRIDFIVQRVNVSPASPHLP